MIRATIILLLLGVWSTFTLSAQALERFKPKKEPTTSSFPSELRNRASINAMCSHRLGIYACTERRGCFLLPSDQPGLVIPVARAQDRQDRFGPILLLEGKPHVVVNGYQLQSLVDSAAQRRNLVPAQFTTTVSAVDYTVMADGRLAIATAADGVFLYTPKGAGQQFAMVPQRLSTVGQQLPSNQVHCLFEDRQGVLWIGTEAGLAAFWQDSVYNLALSPRPQRKPTLWERFLGEKPRGLPTYGGSVTAIRQWGNSLIFTSGDGLYKITRKLLPLTQFHRYARAPTALFEAGVNAVHVSGNGKVWIAADQLVQYDIPTESWRVISPLGGRGGESVVVKCLVQDEASHYLWVGTVGHGLQRLLLTD